MMYWVLFNGDKFWVSAGVQTSELAEATAIPPEDAEKWVTSTRSYDDGGFYPVLVSVEDYPAPGDRYAGGSPYYDLWEWLFTRGLDLHLDELRDVCNLAYALRDAMAEEYYSQWLKREGGDHDCGE